MANFSASGMGGPLQPRPPAPAAPAPMNMSVSAEKRSKLKSYMEGYKDAIESKTAEQLLPNISPLSAPAAMPPMQRPVQQAMPPAMSQPPMMMNMGGMVDVFDPNFMNNLGSEIMDSNEDNIIQGFSNGGFTSNISVKEGDTIGGRPEEKDENDYVENLLSQYDEMYKSPDYTSIQDSVPSQAFETETYQGSNVPVGSLETDRNEILEDALFQNELRKASGMLPSPTSGTVDLGGGAKAPSTFLNALAGSDPGLAIKYQQAGKTQTMGNPLLGRNFTDFMSGDVNPISTAPYTGIEQILSRQAQAGQGDAYKDFFFEEGLREPSIFDPLQSLAQKVLGYPEGMRGLYQMEQDKQVSMARNQQLQEQRRKDQEREERRLAEEQRLRELIESMLPPKDDTIGTGPIGDIDVPLPDTDPIIPETPISPIVESTRVPGFDLANLSPFPQFNMPTQPVLPPIIQPEFFKELLANMKMPVTNMQEGGNVKSLDAAVDNFIEAIK